VYLQILIPASNLQTHLNINFHLSEILCSHLKTCLADVVAQHRAFKLVLRGSSGNAEDWKQRICLSSIVFSIKISK